MSEQFHEAPTCSPFFNTQSFVTGKRRFGPFSCHDAIWWILPFFQAIHDWSSRIETLSLTPQREHASQCHHSWKVYPGHAIVDLLRCPLEDRALGKNRSDYSFPPEQRQIHEKQKWSLEFCRWSFHAQIHKALAQDSPVTSMYYQGTEASLLERRRFMVSGVLGFPDPPNTTYLAARHLKMQIQVPIDFTMQPSHVQGKQRRLQKEWFLDIWPK